LTGSAVSVVRTDSRDGSERDHDIVRRARDDRDDASAN